MMDYPDPPSDLSWFECFVDPTLVSKTISDQEKKKQLPRLCLQFTDKGLQAEREKDKGKLAIEELMLFERKASSMRLCALAAFAALDYDIDYVIDNISRNEIPNLRYMADNFYRIYNEQNLDATFGNWLFYRFVLSIDRRNRLAPPAPRATIASTLSNGQMMPSDPAMVKYEKTQRAIGEIREHVAKARAFIFEMSETPRDIQAPGIQCFLKPFVEMAPKAMSAAFLGDRNVLIECPTPDFSAEKVHLSAADVGNKCLSEFVVYLFTSGDLVEARKALHRLQKPSVDHPLVAINEDVFRSYCQILNVQGTPYSQISPIKPFIFDLNTLKDETMRKSEVFRQRGAHETTGQLQKVYLAENAAFSVAEGHPECIRENIRGRAETERFVKVLKRKMDGIRDKNRLLAIRAHLQYLCASLLDFREILQQNGVNVNNLRSFAVPSEHSKVEKPPKSEQIGLLLRGTDPFWALMTEFDLPLLKNALNELGPFWFPTTMKTSQFLTEILEKNLNSPAHTLQRLLLAKLFQLTRMKNFDGFTTMLKTYFKEFGADWTVMATFESIHVHALVANEKCCLPWERVLFEVNKEQTALIFNPEFKPTMNSSKMINQCLALMLNFNMALIVLEKGGQIPIDVFKCVPIARMLGAYLLNFEDLTTQKKCADGFWRTVAGKLQDVQPPRGLRRGHDVQTARHELSLLFHLFSLIREKRLLDFILGFAVSLHNRLMVLQKKSHLKIHAKYAGLYVPDANAPKLEFSHLDDVRQLLQITCENAYAVSRTDPDTIRSYADFLFVERDFQGAARKYLEYFAAHSPSLRLSPGDFTIFDDSIVQRLRLCTAHSGFLTMSLLTCQFLKSAKSATLQKASHLLKNNETRDVAANCSEFVIDPQTIETLSQHYQMNRMTKSLNTLYAGASSLSANKNVPGTLSQQEVNRRTCKFLTSLASIYFGLHV